MKTIAQYSHMLANYAYYSTYSVPGKEMSDVQIGFRKGQGSINITADPCWITEKVNNPHTPKKVCLYFICWTWVVLCMKRYGMCLEKWDSQNISLTSSKAIIWLEYGEADQFQVSKKKSKKMP